MYSGEVFRLAVPLMLCYVVYYIIWTSLSGSRRRRKPSRLLARTNESHGQ